MCVLSIKVPIRKNLETYLMILVHTYRQYSIIKSSMMCFKFILNYNTNIAKLLVSISDVHSWIFGTRYEYFLNNGYKFNIHLHTSIQSHWVSHQSKKLSKFLHPTIQLQYKSNTMAKIQFQVSITSVNHYCI